MPEIKGEIDIIYNLACPASPPIYQKDPLFTINTSYLGTKNLLVLAQNKSSIFPAWCEIYSIIIYFRLPSEW